MAVLGKAFKASCVDVLLPRELATGQHLLGQRTYPIDLEVAPRQCLTALSLSRDTAHLHAVVALGVGNPHN